MLKNKPNSNPEPWLQNANSMLVLYSILAATCGVFIAIVIQDQDKLSCYWWCPLSVLGLSFFLFIFSAEAVSEALDHKDVEKYISTHILYNLGVICLIIGIVFILFFRYQLNCFIFTVFVFSWHWWKDTFILLTESEANHKKYIQSLIGMEDTYIDRGKCGWTKIFLRIRKTFSKHDR